MLTFQREQCNSPEAPLLLHRLLPHKGTVSTYLKVGTYLIRESGDFGPKSPFWSFYAYFGRVDSHLPKESGSWEVANLADLIP